MPKKYMSLPSCPECGRVFTEEEIAEMVIPFLDENLEKVFQWYGVSNEIIEAIKRENELRSSQK
jgi:hypothetical protein